MKKKLFTFFAVLSIYATLKAQTPVYTENFEKGIPAGYTVINNDKKIPAITTWPKDSGWVSFKDGATNKAAASTSYYNPAGKADDWLITPALNIESGNFLTWRTRAIDPGYRDGYEVKLSLTGGKTIADFTVNLLTVAEETEAWSNRAINLSAYTGKSVTIAFRNTSTDKYILLVDDIKIINPTIKTDLSVTYAELPDYSADKNLAIKGKLTNYGADTVKSFDLNYKIDNGAVVKQNVTVKEFIPLLFGSYSYNHTTPWVTTIGKHVVKIWANNINGKNDEVPANDTLVKSITITDVADLYAKSVLIEGFTSSTCPPCASVNPGLNKLLHANKVNEPGSGIVTIKYQSNFPSPGNDPAYTTESGARRAYYNVTGIPNSQVNGGKFFTGHSVLIVQKLLDSAKKEKSPFKITLQASYSEKSILITGNVINNIELENKDLRLFVALVEDSVVHEPQTNGEKIWFEVFRKFINTTNGTSLANLKTREAFPFNFDYNFESSGSPKIFSSLAATHVIAFVQNYITKEVQQVNVVKTVKSSAVKELHLTNEFTISPNPFPERTTLHYTISQPEKVELVVYNIIGEKVFYENQGIVSTGSYNITFERNQLPAGLYIATLHVGSARISKKIIIDPK